MENSASILFVFCRKPGGEYLATKNICSILSKNKNLRVLIEEIKNYHFILPLGRFRLLRNFLSNIFLFLKRLKKINNYKNKNFNYVYSPSIVFLFLFILFSRFRKSKIIYHFHGFNYGENNKTTFKYIKDEKLNFFIKYVYLLPFLVIFSQIEKIVLKRAFKIFVPTDYSKSIILKRYPSLDKKKIYTIPNGLDKKIFKPKKNFKPSKYGKLKILYVGRLVKEKGVRELVEAFNLLDKEKYFLTIVYPDSEDMVFEKEIKKYLKNKKNINLVKNPSTKQIVSFYNTHDLTVLISTKDFEQFPLVYLESLVCGTPVLISNKVQGVIDWQRTINSDLIVAKPTKEQISEIILEFSKKSEDERKKISKKCINLSKSFTWKNTVRLFLKNLEDRQ